VFLNVNVTFQDEDRRSLLRTLTEEQYKDVIRVLAMIPVITLEVTTEVVDDEEQHIVTAGAIITVTVVLGRK
jgi:translocation protein SEC63